MIPSFSPTSHPSTSAPVPGGYGLESTPVSAKIVPTDRQTVFGKPATPLADRIHQDYPQRPVMIASPRLAPSSVSSEQALQARALMAPEFHQNIMASRILRTSNLYAETPRFHNQLDILA